MTATTAERLAPLLGHHRLGAAAAPGTLQAFDYLERNTIHAKMQARRVFRTTGDLTADIAAGRVPVVEVPIGSDYARMRDLVASRAPAPVLLTISHEPEHPSKQSSAFTYRVAYDYAWPILTGAPNAVVGATFMAGSAAGRIAGVDLADWMPPAGQIDFVGLDLYAMNPTDPRKQPQQLMQPGLDLAAKHGCALAYPELAVKGTAEEKAAWLHLWLYEVSSLILAGCQCHPIVSCYFNSSVGDPTRVPTNADGSVEWNIGKATDVVPDLLSPAVWAHYLRAHPIG